MDSDELDPILLYLFRLCGTTPTVYPPPHLKTFVHLFDQFKLDQFYNLCCIDWALSLLIVCIIVSFTLSKKGHNSIYLL